MYFCHWSISNRKNCMTGSGYILAAKGSGDFFLSLGNKGFNASRALAKNVLGKSWKSFGNCSKHS